MRRLSFLAPLCVVACTGAYAPPRAAVLNTPPGDHALREEGTPLAVRHWEVDRNAGITPGFRVVKSEREWRELWPNVDADHVPLLPRGMDFGREMLVVSAPPRRDVRTSQIDAAIETADNGVHVYLTQTLPGEGCPDEPERDASPYDFARVPRVDKEVRFHVDSRLAAACAALAAPKVTCRVNGTTEPFQEKLSVPAGKSVACIVGGDSGPRATFDRTWSFEAVPSGSFAKMTVASNGLGVTFPTDVFGHYGLRLEVLDDLGRRVSTAGGIDVTAPKESLVLQEVWTRYDPSDDPTTFPRTELEVTYESEKELDPKAKPAAKGRVASAPAACTVVTDRPPPGCSAQVIGATTVMAIAGGSAPRAHVRVRYVDERVDGQPIVCVRAFHDGAKTADTCDAMPRAADAVWDAGVLEVATGKPPVPKGPAAPPPASPPKTDDAKPAPAAAAR